MEWEDLITQLEGDHCHVADNHSTIFRELLGDKKPLYEALQFDLPLLVKTLAF